MKEAIKLVNSFLYSLIVAFSPLHYLFLLPLFVVLFFEKENFLSIFKKVVLLNFFILFLVVFVYFKDSSEALELFVRTNMILLFNIALFYTSQGYDLARGMQSLGFNSKVVSVLYFTLSLTNFIKKDFKETKNTLKARGFSAGTSMFTYQTYGNIFAMILVKALRKSEDMKVGMSARGFEDKIYFLNSNTIGLFEKVLSFFVLVILLKVGYELFS